MKAFISKEILFLTILSKPDLFDPRILPPSYSSCYIPISCKFVSSCAKTFISFEAVCSLFYADSPLNLLLHDNRILNAWPLGHCSLFKSVKSTSFSSILSLYFCLFLNLIAFLFLACRPQV